MNRHVLILGGLGVVAIAVWAYNVNYRTMTRLERLGKLRGEIAVEREAIRVLKVEWAYLNNPERLSRLAERYKPQLQLVPIPTDAVQKVGKVPFLAVAKPPAGEGPVVALPSGATPAATPAAATPAAATPAVPAAVDTTATATTAAAAAIATPAAARPGIPLPPPRPAGRTANRRPG